LVHEASHVLWRGNHPTNKDKQESIEDATKDEYRSIKNQLAIYVWLRTVSHAQPDWVLDRRLEQEEGGTLRSSIGERLKASRQRQ